MIDDYRNNREVVTALREIADGLVRPIKVVETTQPEMEDGGDELEGLASVPVDAQEMS